MAVYTETYCISQMITENKRRFSKIIDPTNLCLSLVQRQLDIDSCIIKECSSVSVGGEGSGGPDSASVKPKKLYLFNPRVHLVFHCAAQDSQ